MLAQESIESVYWVGAFSTGVHHIFCVLFLRYRLTDFYIYFHIEIILNLTDFNDSMANNYINLLRINVHFDKCAVWIKIIVGP